MSRVQVKICGITQPEIAYQAAVHGAKYIGIILHPESKRHVEPGTARDIAAAAKQGGAKPIAVTVTQTHAQIIELCEKTAIDHIQLHGDIARAAVNKLPDHLIKLYAVPINPFGQPEVSIEQLKLDKKKDYLLFDGTQAGSGQRIETQHLNQIAGDYNYFLAGGLTPRNVNEALANCRPYAVDVATGVEQENHEKSLDLIKRFIASAQNGGIDA